jgi:hypothetical protein
MEGEARYRVSRWLVVVTALALGAFAISLWFADGHPWLFVVVPIVGLSIWVAFILDYSRQGLTFWQAAQGDSKLGCGWLVTLLAVGAAYGLLLGVCKGN